MNISIYTGKYDLICILCYFQSVIYNLSVFNFILDYITFSSLMNYLYYINGHDFEIHIKICLFIKLVSTIFYKCSLDVFVLVVSVL